MKDATRCPHLRRQFYRVVARNGREQVTEKCLDCGGNPRGAGVWVPRSEVPVDPDTLPLLADYRQAAAAPGRPVQRGLFEDVP
jgi:hypothetical protein